MTIYLFLLMTFVVTTCCAQNLGGPKHGKVVVCYIASWAYYRPPEMKFGINNIDPNLCTHLMYAFAGIEEKNYTITSLNPELEKGNDAIGYKALVAIKKQYPHVKVILSVGGWNEGSAKFSKMAANPRLRRAFVRSALDFIRKYGFDGLDIVWKYPTRRGGVAEDRNNFVTLVKELKEAFLNFNYILTATLGDIENIASTAYDLVNLNRYLDLIHIQCYDYYGPWNGVVGPNAPLRGKDLSDIYNVEFAVKYMIAFGVDPDKLVLGMPLYGRTFLLTDPYMNEITLGESVVENVGFRGSISNGTNFYGYYEICIEMTRGKVPWQYHWDKISSTPYVRDEKRVISFEDPRSIANKVRMAIDYNLKGLMVWSIDTDDFNGLCDVKNNTYIDYVNRYHELRKSTILQEKLKDLQLPIADSSGNIDGKSYGILNGRLYFRQPEIKKGKYPLLRTINQAIVLAIEEQEIINVLKNNTVNTVNNIINVITKKDKTDGNNKGNIDAVTINTVDDKNMHNKNEFKSSQNKVGSITESDVKNNRNFEDPGKKTKENEKTTYVNKESHSNQNKGDSDTERRDKYDDKERIYVDAPCIRTCSEVCYYGSFVEVSHKNYVV